MKLITKFFLFSLVIFLIACAQSEGAVSDQKDVIWVPNSNIEQFWQNYADSKGGITWGKSSTYPDYSQVQEGDTFWVELEQGPCLMEFFHSRWRIANDVRRWDRSMNNYGGCPYVFN